MNQNAKNNRNGLNLESLEGRTMMSVVPHVVSAAVKEAVSTTLKTNLKTVVQLAAPSSLTAVNSDTSTVSLTWTDNANTATGYIIYRSSNGGAVSKIATLTDGSATSYADTNIVTGQTYQYQVVATTNTQTSARSNTATVTTALVAPSSLSATGTTGGGVTLGWTDNDSNATGYLVLRSRDGKNFYADVRLANASANSFVDTAADSGEKYYYEIVAYRGSVTSAASAAASATIAVAAPSGLTTSIVNGAITLNWTGNDKWANAYQILRSTDNHSFSVLNTSIVTSYTDIHAKTGITYYYEVTALHNSVASAATSSASNVLPLAAPSNLTLSSNQNSTVNLSWTSNDTNATGYDIQVSTDGGKTWSDLAQVSGVKTTTYTDSTTSDGSTYTYEVKATSTSAASAFSKSAMITVQSANAAVTIATRYTNELVITAKGLSDSVSISESNGLVNITADGQSYTAPIPAAGIFIYTRGGTDSITIDSTDATRTTVMTIDGAATTINSSANNVSAWIDSTDTLTGSATTHKVTTFVGGVTKAQGAALADPSDMGAKTQLNMSLFGTAPVESDINQGATGDCYFLSSLAAFAHSNPGVVAESAVDMGDGTYAVQFYNNGSPVFVRVNSDISQGYTYAKPGANNTAWAMVLEKAFCYFRSGKNTYASINSGWMGEVYADLGVNSTNIAIGSSDNTLFTQLQTALNNGKAVTFGTNTNPPNLVGGHAYTLVGVTTDNNGVHHYLVRNPWGVSGKAIEDAHGYATLTFAQMQANFTAGCVAV